MDGVLETILKHPSIQGSILWVLGLSVITALLSIFKRRSTRSPLNDRLEAIDYLLTIHEKLENRTSLPVEDRTRGLKLVEKELTNLMLPPKDIFDLFVRARDESRAATRVIIMLRLVLGGIAYFFGMAGALIPALLCYVLVPSLFFGLYRWWADGDWTLAALTASILVLCIVNTVFCEEFWGPVGQWGSKQWRKAMKNSD